MISLKNKKYNDSLFGKKGQITIFMIVGIILLFSTALIFYIRGQVVDDVQTEAQREIEDVPVQSQPIKLYVENCIEQVSRKALENVGRHGGYADPFDFDVGLKEFTVTPHETDSEAITILDEKAIVPYWLYLKSSNECSGDCEFASFWQPISKVGGEMTIEAQIDRYVDKHLVECIDEFRTFKRQGYEFEAGAVVTDTKINEQDVTVFVTYPIKMSRDGKTTSFERFMIKHDINFKEIYDMATEIMEAQRKNNYLETHIMNMIVMYSYPISNDKLPPIAEYKIDPNSFHLWITQAVKQKIKNYVLPNAMSMMKVAWSRDFVYQRKVLPKLDDAGNIIIGANGQPEINRYATRIASDMAIPLEKNYTNIRANFMYMDDWNIYLDINGEEVLTGQQIDSFWLSWIGISTYEHWYSLSFPVLVTLQDPEAFNGEGYTFNFAMEQNLRYNEPINTSSVTVKRTPQGTQVCEENQQHSPEWIINVTEFESGRGVENARVNLIFGTEGCRLGLTQKIDNQTIIRTKLPLGWGEMKVRHPDYIDYEMPVFVSPNRGQNLTIEMMPYRYINVTVFLRSMIYDRTTKRHVMPHSAPVAPMPPDNKWILIMERLNDDLNKGYKTIAQGIGHTTVEVKLMPGEYAVDIIMLPQRTVVIPEEEIEADDEIVIINETILTPGNWTNGGVYLNENNGLFEIDYDSLFMANRINFYAMRMQDPTTHGSSIGSGPSFEEIGKIEEYSARYRYDVEPQFIR